MEKKVEFKVGELTLRGTLFIPKGEGPFPGVVIYHGRGSSRVRYLNVGKKLSEIGILTLVFDFRGCGESDGILEDGTQRMGINDARAGLEFLLRQNVDQDRIGISGSSFGGFVGAVMAGEYNVKSLVLRAPASYPNESLDTYVDSIEDLDFSEKSWLNSVSFEKIAKFKGDLLVVQSEKDEVVKPWIVRAYYDKAINTHKKELFILKGAPHSLSNSPKFKKKFEEKTLDWFTQTL